MNIPAALHAGAHRLDLRNCNLTELPAAIYQLADTLEILDLSDNALTALPDDLHRLHKLRILFCSNNRFESVPEVLGRCPSLEMVGFKANRIAALSAAALPPRLRWLILTDNRLEALPTEIGRCRRLQKLMLAGNRLQNLPEELSACTQLELLRIAANRLSRLPEWLFSLPNLAWLAFAGNPCCSEQEQAAHRTIPSLDWNTLEVQDKLGEGASGIIYRALLPGADQPVAIKLFKGALTSDGLPHSEQSAWIAAGSHPHLIPVDGRIAHHPDDTPGLVMPLVDPRFRTLAAPPSLASCTRDVYPQTAVFSFDEAVHIAYGIAKAVAHLHRLGIMHGDLYAHNIQWDDRRECLLGDFGAASFMPADSAIALQRIEARAFACLLEELLQRCAFSSENQPLADALWALQHRCMQPDVAQRPRFDEIEDALAALIKASADP